MTTAPDQGARILLERTQAAGTSAQYRVTTTIAGIDHITTASIDGSAAARKVSLDAWQPSEPPVWLVDFVGNLLQMLLKNFNGRAWPRRVHRWRTEH